MAITVPTEGRPTGTSSESLLGLDSNAFMILGATQKLLRRGGASPEYIAAFQKEATSGGYDHLLAAAMAYLDAGEDNGDA